MVKERLYRLERGVASSFDASLNSFGIDVCFEEERKILDDILCHDLELIVRKTYKNYRYFEHVRQGRLHRRH